MTINDSNAHIKLKEQGNTHFKQGQYEEAVTYYTQAIKACEDLCLSEIRNELAVLYKNRAACHLKKEMYEDAAKDSTKSLELVSNDPKALFRRAQAYEKLNRLEDAMKDAKSAYQIEPKNTALKEILRRISTSIQSKVGKTQTTEGMVNEMIGIILNPNSDKEKRNQALNNLTILAHQSAGSIVMYETQALNRLKPLIFCDNASDVVSFLKMVHGLCKENYGRSLAMMQLLPVSELRSSLGKFTTNIDVVSNLLSVVMEVITSLVAKARQLYPLALEDSEKWVKRNNNNEAIKAFLEGINEYKELMISIVGNFTNPHLSAAARDCVIDALIKLLPLHKAIAEFVLENHGVKSLLQVSACSGTLCAKGKPLFDVTETTYTHVAIALSNMFNHLQAYDKQKGQFKKDATAVVLKFFDEYKLSENVKGLTSLIAILEASIETGEEIFSNDSVLKRLLHLAESDELEVKVMAAEALAYAASIKKTCTSLRTEGMGILKSLFKSTDNSLRVRGLVCMSKVGMAGAGNIKEQYLSEDGLMQLYRAGIEFLLARGETETSRKLAVEAIAFLTMSADIKEEIIADKKAMEALLEVGRTGDSTSVYGICNCLVNLTNSFDKPERNEELEKLAEYAQHNIPKMSEKDGPEYVKKRINILVHSGVTTALVHIAAKIESDSSKESIARIFHAIVSEQENRGIIVQQGGGKTLIPLALSGTEVGKDYAAQAIAKIGITTNPTLAFPGQRCLEVVRPLIRLLGPDKNGLQQFESLMALTNLAQISDDVRKRIIKEKGITAIETFMFEEHELLRQAATECMCNMTMSEDVVSLYLDENSKTERLKLLVLFCGEIEYPKLMKAATGALAILSANEKICEKLTTFKSTVEILKQILVLEDIEVQHRAVFVVANMLESSKEVAELLIAGDVFEILLALMHADGEEKLAIKEHAERGLKAAQGWNLIKENK